MSKYFNSSTPPLPAFGLITIDAVPADGETVTIDTGTFTFQSSGGGGSNIDTSSGDVTTIAGNICAVAGTANLTTEFTGSPSFFLNAVTAGVAGNSIALSSGSTSVTITTSMQGGRDAGPADGNYSDPGLLRFWNDSGNTIPAGALPLATDDVVLQDGATNGTGLAHNLSATGSGAVAGATITCSQSTAPMTSGTIKAPAIPSPDDVLTTAEPAGNFHSPPTNKVEEGFDYGVGGTSLQGSLPASGGGGGRGIGLGI